MVGESVRWLYHFHHLNSTFIRRFGNVRDGEFFVGAALRGRPSTDIQLLGVWSLPRERRRFFSTVIHFHAGAATECRPYSTFREILIVNSFQHPNIDAELLSIVQDGLRLRLWYLHRFKHRRTEVV